VRAIQDIQRLRLFPVVFFVPRSVTVLQGEDYGPPCATLMAEAAALLDAWDAQARPCI
jgi:hypothetical protein